MRENLTYGIDGGLLDKLGEAWSLPYFEQAIENALICEESDENGTVEESTALDTKDQIFHIEWKAI